jgi:lysophospholipase L1-like esterase
MRRIVLLVLAVLVSLGASAEPARVVMFGDSLTARGDWKRLLGPEIVNLGVDGDTIRNATKRVRRIERHHPSVVIVMLGINDLLGGRPPAVCLDDMRRLTSRLREVAPGAHLIVTSVLPVGRSLSRYMPAIEDLNIRLRHLCSDGSCAYLDVAAELEARGISRDDLHLNDAGYERWAAIVKREVAPP